MANVSVLNTTNQLSGKTVAVCENDQTISGAWTFTGNQAFHGNVTIGNAVGDTLTVTSTITSNLLFTDATYDIGASGATRPRDLFLSRNAVVGGTLGVTGVATFTAVPVFNGTAATTFNGDVTLAGTTPLLTIGDAGEEDAGIVFDGNAQDFYIALDDSADDLVIGLGNATGTTPIIEIDADRVVTLSTGKLKFPATQSASADVNVLDDYEEGSWTPVIAGEGGTSGQTYTTQNGRYTKIGRLVTLECYVRLSVEGTITGNVIITGLPFTPGQEWAAACGWNNLATNWVNVNILYQSAQLRVVGAAAAATSNQSALTATDIGNSTEFFFTVSFSV